MNAIYESKGIGLPIASRTCQCHSVHKQNPQPNQYPNPTHDKPVNAMVTKCQRRVHRVAHPSALKIVKAL